jgi:Tfp pilus assembly PilM family ATPase
MAQKKSLTGKARGKVFSVNSLMEKSGLFHSTGRSVIGLEISADVLRVIEIDRSTKPYRIVNFSAIDPLMNNAAEAADQILGLMHEKGISGRLVHAPVIDQSAEIRQVPLPIIGKNEMPTIVRRELKKILPDASPKDISFDFWYDKNVKKGRKADVLIGVAPKESTQRIVSLMEQVGLDTELLTLVPLALISALKTLDEKYLNRVTAMVHLERERSFLAIGNRGNWVFSREFQSVLVKEEIPEEAGKVDLDTKRKFVSARYRADQDRLLVEVNRSLLYFKQRFRGEGVSSAVLSGEAYNLDKITESFQNNLGVEAEIFSPAEFFDFEHLGDRAAKLRRIFPSLALPLGAAVQTLRDAKINFVPPAYINRYKTKAHRLVMAAVSVIFFLVMMTYYLMVLNTRLDLQRAAQVNNQEKELADLTKRLDDFAQITAQRNLARTRKEFLEKHTSLKSPTESLLLFLSQIVPDDLLLFNLTVDEKNGNSTEIIGQIKGRGIADSDKIFSSFFEKLKNSGLFTEVREPVLSTGTEQGLYFLSFKIDCKLKG